MPSQVYFALISKYKPPWFVTLEKYANPLTPSPSLFRFGPGSRGPLGVLPARASSLGDVVVHRLAHPALSPQACVPRNQPTAEGRTPSAKPV